MKEDDDFAKNRLRGIEAIAKFKGDSPRRCYYLASRGQLRGVFKEGNSYVGLKSIIREEEERAARGAT